jgi:GH15 family glucan-1,4-alpha-glucosidase
MNKIALILATILLNIEAFSQWKQIPDYPGLGQTDAVAFSIGSKGYVGTGFGIGGGSSYHTKDFWEYDPNTNAWTQKADFGGNLREYAVGFSIGSKGYVGTGYDNFNLAYKKDLWEYDPNNNTWTQKADFPGHERIRAVGFSVGSKGYIGTGEYYWGIGDFKDFWEYDPNTDTWTQKADFAGGLRDDAIGFSIGSKGYIGTGKNWTSDSTSIMHKDFWEYNPRTNTWSQKADFAGGERYGAEGFSIGSKGYIGTQYDKTFWEYNPNTNIWKQKPNCPGTDRWLGVGYSIGSKGYLGLGVWYNNFWEYTPEETETEPEGTFQGPCSVEGTVGNGKCAAGFTQEGRLSTLWYPSVSSYTFVEYRTDISNGPSAYTEEYYGAEKKLGSFAGIRIDDNFTWLMKKPDWNQAIGYENDNSGVLNITYTTNGTDISEKSFMCSDRNVLIRSFTIENTSSVSHNYKFNYYSLFNINDEYQVALLGFYQNATWITYDNASQSLVWWGPENNNKYGIAVGSDNSYSITKKSTGIKNAIIDPDAFENCENGIENIYQYQANSPNGYIGWDLGDINAGQSKTITIYIAIGDSKDDAVSKFIDAKNTGYNSLYGTTNNYWVNWLSQAVYPAGLAGTYLSTYKRALIALLMNTDDNNGGISASPVTQPQYYPVWPRDGTYNAVALASAGYLKIAKKYFDTFLSKAQESDGHWKRCYVINDANGTIKPIPLPNDIIDVENDQIPTVVWGIYNVWKISNDNSWLNNVWPMVRNSVDYLIDSCIDTSHHNLLEMTCDFKEEPISDIRSSLYTNSIAVSGLRCASSIAAFEGDNTKSQTYWAWSDSIYNGIITHLWDASNNAFYTADGYLGLYHNWSEGGIHMAISCPYNVFSATDNYATGTASNVENFYNTTNDPIWVPSRLFLPQYWKRKGDYTQALTHIDYALNHLTQSGWIAETIINNGELRHAKPLSWAQSMYILAILDYYGVELPEPPSGIKETAVDNTNLFIYPNPNEGLFNMLFRLENMQNVEFKVLNNLGEVVYSEIKSYQSGINSNTLNLSNLRNGIYFLVATIGNKSISKKISIIK